MSENEQTQTFSMVYAGLRKDGNTRRYAWYLAAAQDDGETFLLLEEQPRLWSKQLANRPGIGAVFEITGQSRDDGSLTVWSGTATYIARYPDWNAITRWAARDKADRLALEMANKQAKEMRQDLITDALAPLRDAYHALPSSKRRLLLAFVIEYVTGAS